ncbi:hypothetical protein HELRODRAFT_169005 [Helobdella robusta]|uniref:Uncharacterized protein n=1 Tax=Helobdella robusta TaxID=6412 RepID=T1F191_HELRO|nr:hypothetical protein HELRODRAFT_169005 [Helobdella robusta]ESO09068.1 hypothetical protein HELRODRAFT_169005 [Helobdella robusta]
MSRNETSENYNAIKICRVSFCLLRNNSLVLFIGIIIYIAAITDEAANRSKTELNEEFPIFVFHYGPPLKLLITTFFSAEIAGVMSVQFYFTLRRKASRTGNVSEKVSKRLCNHVEVLPNLIHNINKNNTNHVCSRSIENFFGANRILTVPANIDRKFDTREHLIDQERVVSARGENLKLDPSSNDLHVDENINKAINIINNISSINNISHNIHNNANTKFNNNINNKFSRYNINNNVDNADSNNICGAAESYDINHGGNIYKNLQKQVNSKCNTLPHLLSPSSITQNLSSISTHMTSSSRHIAPSSSSDHLAPSSHFMSSTFSTPSSSSVRFLDVPPHKQEQNTKFQEHLFSLLQQCCQDQQQQQTQLLHAQQHQQQYYNETYEKGTTVKQDNQLNVSNNDITSIKNDVINNSNNKIHVNSVQPLMAFNSNFIATNINNINSMTSTNRTLSKSDTNSNNLDTNLSKNNVNRMKSIGDIGLESKKTFV